MWEELGGEGRGGGEEFQTKDPICIDNFCSVVIISINTKCLGLFVYNIDFF